VSTDDAGGDDQTPERDAPSADRVREVLREVVDPCTAATGANLDVVEMGLVDTIDASDGDVQVSFRLTTPACHMVPYFIEEIETRVDPLDGVESVTVDTDSGMEWTPELMSSSAKEKRRAVLDRYDARYDRASTED
jgi:metal-sulfur cluster biosynthetic enzyme